MKNITSLTVGLLMLMGITHAQQKTVDDSSFTQGFQNGRFWLSLDTFSQDDSLAVGKLVKLAYLLGYDNGVDWMSVMVIKNTTLKKSVSETVLKKSVTETANEQALTNRGFTINDYRRELDLLYSDTENVNIPILFGIDYCRDKLSGKYTRAELERRLISLRTQANKNAVNSGR